jgi:flavodoxin
MKISVVYLSRTGHSKRIAEAIAAELHIQAQSVQASPKLSGVDLLFIVGGIYAGKSDPRMVEYVQKLDSSMVKRAALITSCASKRNKQDMVRDALVRSGIQVAPDEFICRGNFLFLGAGHPNRKDIDDALSFVRKVIGVSKGSSQRRGRSRQLRREG